MNSSRATSWPSRRAILASNPSSSGMAATVAGSFGGPADPSVSGANASRASRICLSAESIASDVIAACSQPIRTVALTGPRIRRDRHVHEQRRALVWCRLDLHPAADHLGALAHSHQTQRCRLRRGLHGAEASTIVLDHQDDLLEPPLQDDEDVPG